MQFQPQPKHAISSDDMISIKACQSRVCSVSERGSNAQLQGDWLFGGGEEERVGMRNAFLRAHATSTGTITTKSSDFSFVAIANRHQTVKAHWMNGL